MYTILVSLPACSCLLPTTVRAQFIGLFLSRECLFVVCGGLDVELAALTRRRSCLVVCPEAGSCLAGSGSHCVARVDSRVLTRTRMCVFVRVGV